VDASQIQHILFNLLENAADAAVSAGVRRPLVEVRTRRTDNHRVEIRVRDNGPGIPTEHLPKLAHGLFTTKPKGTGVGLLICRAMVEAHRGSLSFENHKRGGGVARVILPTGAEDQQ
jgi:two-component system sensor histidine kinase HupT/HoxJ